MREIKFRAWNKNLKEMAFGVDLIFNKEKLESVRSSEWEGDSEPEAWNPGVDGYVSPDEVILEQFTGLLDRNGKEIYEGDIVQSYKVEYPSRLEAKDKVYCVEWGLFGFTLKDPTNADLMSYYVSPEYLEVIGDVHQNPELL